MLETGTRDLFIRETTYQTIKDYVLSGEIGPGDRLNQEFLAERLKVSRTPIREALYRLSQEGIIEPYDTRGFRVSPLSADELEEIFDIRSVIEGFAMQEVCRHITDQTLATLSQTVAKTEDALKIGAGRRVFEHASEFHNTLYQVIEKKQRLYNLLINLKEYSRRYREDTLVLDSSATRRTAESHKKILMALKMRDPLLAEYLMRRHIQQSKRDAMRLLYGLEKTDPTDLIEPYSTVDHDTGRKASSNGRGD